jgi:hypothetical protein
MLKLFRKKSIKNLGQHNCYLTIDELPIRIWFDIHKEGDYTKLIKTSIKLTDNNLLEISNIWSKMYNEYINKFGLSDEFMSDLRDEIKLANLQADYIITGQAYFKTLINIEKEKKRIFDLEIKEPQDLEVVLAKMSKYYGFKLNSRELTTTEYYSYLENVTDGKN